MNKASLELMRVDLNINQQTVQKQYISRMYKNSFELFKNNPYPIDECKHISWRIPLDGYYKIYRLGFKYKSKSEDMNYIFICTKNYFQDLKFNWLLKNNWFQKNENLMWIINIFVAILAIMAIFK